MYALGLLSPNIQVIESDAASGTDKFWNESINGLLAVLVQLKLATRLQGSVMVTTLVNTCVHTGTLFGVSLTIVCVTV